MHNSISNVHLFSFRYFPLFSILFIFYFNRKHIKNIDKYVEKEYHRKSARPGLNPRAVDTSLTIRLNCRTFPPYGTRNTLQESIPDRRIGSRSVFPTGKQSPGEYSRQRNRLQERFPIGKQSLGGCSRPRNSRQTIQEGILDCPRERSPGEYPRTESRDRLEEVGSESNLKESIPEPRARIGSGRWVARAISRRVFPNREPG